MSESRSLFRFLHRLARRHDDDVTDRQLLERFASAGEESAFSTLVERHGPMVLGVCRRVLHHAHDAEDAFQATFLVLARKAGSLRQPEALGSWLYGVAYRTALEARTKALRRRARERELTEEPTVAPNGDLVWNELRAVLDGEINCLPQKYRSPFVLCYLEGRTNEDAARLLRCPKGTILSRLAWARQRLRTRLARRGVVLSAASATAFFTVDTLAAAVPLELVNATAAAARHFVAGQAVSATAALTLAQSVLKTLAFQQLKTAALVLAAIVLVGSGLVWIGQPLGAVARRDTSTPRVSVLNQERLDILLALETNVWEATKNRDFATLRKLCAEDYVAILSDGSRLTLAEICLVLPFVEIKRYTLSDVRLVALGPDGAILTYQVDSAGTILGESFEERTRHSSTWVRRAGEWRNIFYQETLID